MPILVAVCDDNQRVISDIEKHLEQVTRNKSIKFETSDFGSGEKLCASIESGCHYDIIFLDIGLPKINGIEVGKAIRDKYNNEHVSIIYISSEKNHSMQLFSTRPMDFLIKPIGLKEIADVVKAYLKFSRFWDATFSFSVNHDVYKVKIKDIAYFERSQKKLILHKADGDTYKFNSTLKKIYDEALEEYNFLMPHEAYLVNYSYVEIFESDQLTLRNGLVLPVSKARRSHIKERQLKAEENKKL